MIRAEVRALTPQLHPSLGPSADPQLRFNLDQKDRDRCGKSLSQFGTWLRWFYDNSLSSQTSYSRPSIPLTIVTIPQRHSFDSERQALIPLRLWNMWNEGVTFYWVVRGYAWRNFSLRYSADRSPIPLESYDGKQKIASDRPSFGTYRSSLDLSFIILTYH